MYVFIDDSGDPGFKFGQGSSNFLVIACCVFESVNAIEQASNLVTHLAFELNSGHSFELKFNKSSHNARIKFLKEICSLDFFIRVMVIDKRIASKRNDFLIEMIAETLRRSSGVISNAKIRIDGTKPAKIANEISRRIRNAANRDSPVIHSVRFRDSKSSPLIQMADMIAGAARKTFEDEKISESSYLRHLDSLVAKPKSQIWLLNEK